MGRTWDVRERECHCHRNEDDFLERFQELILFESNAYLQDHPFRNVRAMPADVALPPIWLLGCKRIAHRRARLFAGSPATILAKLLPMIAATRADEVMINHHGLRPCGATAIL